VTDVSRIIALSDKGKFPAEIAAALDIPAGRVYHVLRAERPKRERKPRERTSNKRPKVLALHDKGIKPARIAFVLRVSRAYVYRILSELSQ
jgi:DNA invertase Pin-like site-specific DNA recombinase